ncbi:CRTAC1 family protein [Candidatus Poribacteria bacterium]|nr:CRTAC1 family protein [Candidatus Poribacteria bacterium]MYI94621.1 CRTAC1 family protein [Candidatus Poribacteria bacterium]
MGLLFVHRFQMKLFIIIVLTLWINFAYADIPQAVIKFTPVTKEAGIQFRHFNGAIGQKHLVETMGGGTAFFDYNNDDYLDIYLVNGAPLTENTPDVLPTNQLYQNNGNGTFTDVTLHAGVGDTSYGIGCCVGDYDNDGNSDLFVTNFGKNVLYRNNGDGTFSDVSQQVGITDRSLFSAGCAFADYDNDGWLDLVVVNYVLLDLEDAPDCSQEGIPAYCRPEEFAPVPDHLYRNNGDGSFTNVTQEAGINLPGRGLGVVWTDIDNNGWLDLYIANDREANFLYINNGDGTFTEAGELHGAARNEHGDNESSMGIDTADYDNDGDLDIILTHYQAETNTLYQNDGSGVFWDVTAQTRIGEPTHLPLAWGTGFVDFDNDGWLDLFFANGHLHDNVEDLQEVGVYKQQNQLFHNLGNRTYSDITDKSGDGLRIKKSSRGAIFGDYDNDGDMDILVTNIGDSPDLLRNDTAPINNWISIKMIGKKSNRDAIGAKVKLKFGETSTLMEMKSGGSYLSQNQFRSQIGLGTAKKVDQIIVNWRHGVQDVIEDVQSNQHLTIREEDGIISVEH